jgi:hypothetical protein
MSDLFGFKEIIDYEDLFKYLTRLGVDLFFTTLLVRGIYARVHRSREYVFTYFLFNVITFSMCLLLRKVPTELGFALGLFAVFGILRYRTEPIRLIDLTYMFIVIGLAIVNAVANKRISLAELLAFNSVIVGMAALLQLSPAYRASRTTRMFYDNLELLKPNNKDELLADLRKRTGLAVVHIELERIDMLRDAAEITLYHTPSNE